MKVGILGGGQLGMMMLEAKLDSQDLSHLALSFLESSKDCSVGSLDADLITVGDFKDFEDVYAFGKDKDVVTVEIEHVNVEALEKLESEGVAVHPSSKVLRTVQDKGRQKEFYANHDIPTSSFKLLDSRLDILDTDLPVVQKSRTGGYDGQGVAILRSPQDLETKALEGPFVLEQAVDIDKEISVIVLRKAPQKRHNVTTIQRNNDSCSVNKLTSCQVAVYPPVEMAFDPETNLVTELFSPSTLTPKQAEEAREIALKVAEQLEIVGLLAVELFLDTSGKILVNEVAPRPHNSGHHTIEGNITSQFENHLRAISGMDLGDTGIIKPGVMVNVLGEKGHRGPAIYEGLEKVKLLDEVYVHLYHKSHTKPARKMGHVTILADTVDESRAKGRMVRETLKVVSE